MSLSTLKFGSSLVWANSVSITGFNADQQSGNEGYSVAPTIGASNCTNIFIEQRTLAASGSQTYDMTALTDPQNQSINAVKWYGIVIQNSGDGTLNSNNGNLKWDLTPLHSFIGPFAGATAINVNEGGVFSWSSIHPQTVSSTAKIITITNLDGAHSCTYKLEIALGV